MEQNKKYVRKHLMGLPAGAGDVRPVMQLVGTQRRCADLHIWVQIKEDSP